MATPYVTAAVAMMISLDPTLDSEEIRAIPKKTSVYTDSSPAGDLNLTAALDEVIYRLTGKDISSFNSRKELEKQYRQELKEKMKRISETN